MYSEMPGVFGEFALIADETILKKVTGTKESAAVLRMKHLTVASEL